eukprot:3053304-Prymnesium_polylepis.1
MPRPSSPAPSGPPTRPPLDPSASDTFSPWTIAKVSLAIAASLLVVCCLSRWGCPTGPRKRGSALLTVQVAQPTARTLTPAEQHAPRQ